MLIYVVKMNIHNQLPIYLSY